MLRLAIPLTVLVATSAHAMRPLPDHITSKNVIDMRGEWPERRAERIPGQINWHFPAKIPASVNAKYGPPDVPWDNRFRDECPTRLFSCDVKQASATR